MTYAEIESGARTLVQDATAPYRFGAEEVYGYVNQCLRTLFKLRPTAFFSNGRMPTSASFMEPLTVSVVLAAGGGVDVPAPSGDRYLDAAVYYTAAKCLERDDADTLNAGLSASYMAKFSELATM